MTPPPRNCFQSWECTDPFRTCSMHLRTYINVYPYTGAFFLSHTKFILYVLSRKLLIQFYSRRCLRELAMSILLELPDFNCCMLSCNMNIPPLFSSSPTDNLIIFHFPYYKQPCSEHPCIPLYAYVQTFLYEKHLQVKLIYGVCAFFFF